MAEPFEPATVEMWFSQPMDVDATNEAFALLDTSTGALVAWDLDRDGDAEGSVLLKNIAKSDLRQSDFMFDEEPGFVAGISTVGSYYLFSDSVDWAA